MTARDRELAARLADRLLAAAPAARDCQQLARAHRFKVIELNINILGGCSRQERLIFLRAGLPRAQAALTLGHELMHGGDRRDRCTEEMCDMGGELIVAALRARRRRQATRHRRAKVLQLVSRQR